MPLIILCGFPSSGKTYRARQIIEYFEARSSDEPATSGTAVSSTRTLSTVAPLTASSLGLVDNSATCSTTTSQSQQEPSESSTTSNIQALHSSHRRRIRVHHISDSSLSLPRTVYSHARTEKDARASLYSAVKRALGGKDDVVILDTMNYIKGWRYQLHCEAKAVGSPSCVVHVGTEVERCRDMNDKRLAALASRDAMSAAGEGSKKVEGGNDEEDPYSKGVFEELLMRFEEPNAMARWDSPLFTVPWEDATPPCLQIWDAMMDTVGKDGKSRAIRPNQATVMSPATQPDQLYELDRTTQAILAHIQVYQRDHQNEGGGTVMIPLASTTASPASAFTRTAALELPTNSVPFAQWQRLRRQFITLQRQQMGGIVMGGIASSGGDGDVGELFVDWLNDSLGGSE